LPSTGAPQPRRYRTPPLSIPRQLAACRRALEPPGGEIVAAIFKDYCLRSTGLGEICGKLNRDLDRYPRPKRNRKDEMPLRQTWRRSQIQAMRNPKYTG
jgi:hypothetical protein